jgi:putative urate catabolism protein
MPSANPYAPDFKTYPRDLVGYGRTPPDPRWPGNAAIAVQIVINYEEGGENCILHGDAGSESYLAEVAGVAPRIGARNLIVESQHEYGSRAGFWRLHRLLTARDIPVTVYGVTMALARNPEAVAGMNEAGWEVASHGMRWIDYSTMKVDDERKQIAETIALHTSVVGERPLGWYAGRLSERTTQLVAEAGGFLYQADSYADDLPYWTMINNQPELIVPYAPDNNDMRFCIANGFGDGEQFARYLIDSFDVLHAEGLAGAPKMMSIGLHCRLAGRPGRIAGLMRFLDHAQAKERVWFTRRLDIARHWRAEHPAA